MKKSIKMIVAVLFAATLLGACSSGGDAPLYPIAGPVAAEAVYIDPEAVTIGVGQTLSLSTVFAPANATNKNVTWQSGDEAVVTVNDDGEIQGVISGFTTITVTSEDGDFTSVCAVRVIMPVEQFSFTNCPDGYVIIDKEGGMSLQLAILPMDATHVRLQWFSTNLDAVDFPMPTTINSRNIRGLETGEANIIVSTWPSMETTSCRVIVKEAVDDPPVSPGTTVFTTIAPSPTDIEIPGLPAYPGEKLNFKRGSLEFNMVYVWTPLTFPIGVNDDEFVTMSAEEQYFIGDTEVTYEHWYTVRMWATTNRGDGKRADGGDLYSFYWRGMGGSEGIEGEPPTDDNKNHPVTHISWREAMVWTNALTEYYNAHRELGQPELTCVYYTDSGYTTPIRLASYGEVSQTAGSQDNPFVNEDADGFRLPTSREWEVAARFRAIDTTNAISGAATLMYTRGNSASDAWTFYNDVTLPPSWTPLFPGQAANREVAVYARFQYFTSNSIRFITEPVTSTAEVKTRRANTLGLYDMSGNVAEFCFDRYRETNGPSQIFRVLRGGAWGTKDERDYLLYGDNKYLQIGLETRVDPRYVAPRGYNTGFRLAQSAFGR